MILKISNNHVINWDKVNSILTRDLNIHETCLFGKEYAVEIHRGDEGYTDYPFAITVETDAHTFNIYRTDSAEDMQLVYDEILRNIITEYGKHNNICDISMIVKNHDLYKKHVTANELEQIKREKIKEVEDIMKKMDVEMREVRIDG